MASNSMTELAQIGVIHLGNSGATLSTATGDLSYGNTNLNIPTQTPSIVKSPAFLSASARGTETDFYAGVGPAYAMLSTDGAFGAGVDLGLAGFQAVQMPDGALARSVHVVGVQVMDRVSIPLEEESYTTLTRSGGWQTVTPTADFDRVEIPEGMEYESRYTAASLYTGEKTEHLVGTPEAETHTVRKFAPLSGDVIAEYDIERVKTQTEYHAANEYAEQVVEQNQNNDNETGRGSGGRGGPEDGPSDQNFLEIPTLNESLATLPGADDTGDVEITSPSDFAGSPAGASDQSFRDLQATRAYLQEAYGDQLSDEQINEILETERLTGGFSGSTANPVEAFDGQYEDRTGRTTEPDTEISGTSASFDGGTGTDSSDFQGMGHAPHPGLGGAREVTMIADDDPHPGLRGVRSIEALTENDPHPGLGGERPVTGDSAEPDTRASESEPASRAGGVNGLAVAQGIQQFQHGLIGGDDASIATGALRTAAGATGDVILGATGDLLGATVGLERALSNSDELAAAGRATGLASSAGLLESGSTFGAIGGTLAGMSGIADLNGALHDGNYAGALQGASTAANLAGNALGNTSLTHAASALGGAVPAVGLAHSVTEGDALGAAISAVTLANPVVGIGLSVFGGALGGAFGSSPPTPRAHAEIASNEYDRLELVDHANSNGGDRSAMIRIANNAVDTINDLLDMTGGRLLEPGSLEPVAIRQEGDKLYVNDNVGDINQSNPNGWGRLDPGGQRVHSGEEAVGYMISDVLDGVAIEGGDPYIKRVLYQHVEHAPVDVEQLHEDLAIAVEYSELQHRGALFEHLAEDPAIAAELEAHAEGETDYAELSATAQQILHTREIKAAAEAIGLDQSHPHDRASRVNLAFDQAGIDLDGVTVEDLVVVHDRDRLVIGIAEDGNPDTALGHGRQIEVPWDDHDHASATLYLPDSADTGGWNLARLLAKAGIDPAAGPVHLQDAFAGLRDTESAVIAGTDETVAGTEADNTLIGIGHGAVLQGIGGDNIFISGVGANTLVGGEGVDTADYSQSSEGVHVDLGIGAGLSGNAAGDVLIDIDNLTGSEHDDVLIGSKTDNRIAANGGDNILAGNAGNNTLIGGNGSDHLMGGAGNDALLGGRGDDILEGMAGDNIIRAGSGDNLLQGGEGDDILLGGAGDDLLIGGGGANVIRGGTGNDTIIANGTGDIIDGGGGDNTVVYEDTAASFTLHAEGDRLYVKAGQAEQADEIINVETIRFSDKALRVEDVIAHIEAMKEPDEERRHYRLTGNPTAGGTVWGDAAAIGLVAAYATSMSARADDTVVEVPAATEADLLDMAPTITADIGFEFESGGTPGGTPPAPPTRTEAPGETFTPVVPGFTVHSHADAVPPGDVAPPDLTMRGTPVSVEETTPAEVAALFEEVEATGEGGVSPEPQYPEDPRILRGTDNADVLIDHYGYNFIYGQAGDDVIDGVDGHNIIHTGRGNNTVIASPGGDTIHGGPDFDTMTYRRSDEGVVIDLDAGRGYLGWADGDRLYGIDVVEGSRYNDVLIGGTGAHELIGNGGSNQYIGGSGDTRIVMTAEDELAAVDGGGGRNTVEYAAKGLWQGDLRSAHNLDHIIAGTGGFDLTADWGGIDRIEGNGGDTRLVLDGASVFDLEFDWTLENGVALSDDDHEIELIDVEEVILDNGENTVFLDGRDNAPFVRSPMFLIDEGGSLEFSLDDLLSHTVTVDPGDLATVTAVGGFEPALQDNLDSGYWQTGALSDFLTAADGDFSHHDYGLYEKWVAKAPNIPVYLGSPPDPIISGGAGDDVLFGQILHRYSGVDASPDDPTQWTGVRRAMHSLEIETYHADNMIYGVGGNNVFVGSDGSDTFVGTGSGADMLDLSRSSGAVLVDLLQGTGSGGWASGDSYIEINNVLGSSYSDTLIAGNNGSVLQGGGGDNRLYAGLGDDVLIGGGGQDAGFFNGVRDDYEIAAHGGHIEVTDLRGDASLNQGVNRLHAIERLGFADGSVFVGDEAVTEQGKLTIDGDSFVYTPDWNAIGSGAIPGFDFAVTGQAGESRSAMVDLTTDPADLSMMDASADALAELLIQEMAATSGSEQEDLSHLASGTTADATMFDDVGREAETVAG